VEEVVGGLMELRAVVETDYADVVELANLAYRGTGEGASWNAETGIIEGVRIWRSLARSCLFGGTMLGC